MSEPDRRPSVSLYRDKAATLRMFANQMGSPESRLRVLRLAESFDRLADQVENWENGIPEAANLARQPAQYGMPGS